MTPRLSVVTACYQHGAYLEECIASVRAQTEPDIEHVIVIDGSPDDSKAVAWRAADLDPSERISVIVNETNRGLAYSQNRGITVARAPWVLKVDADDTIAPTYIEEILAAADADPRRNVIFSPCRHVGARRDVYRYPAFDASRMADVLMIAGCAAVKRDLWAAVGGHDETMRYAEDWDLYVRAALAVGLVPYQLDGPRWCYRVHSGPRASHAGMANLPELRKYWRGHTRETVLARSRKWAWWLSETGRAA